METTKLRRFAQYARRTLMELVEARLQLVLQPGSAARRENVEAIKKLEEAIKGRGEAQVIERVAYTWFNRFCALRFMDVNRYTRIGVVSPAEGQFQPEILAEAKMGHVDDETVPEKIRQQIFALLEGKSPSHDPQGEAYRLLVVAACNAFHRAMPFLFERIDDYTELLMPDDLLSGNSILAYTREAMTPDACEDVEVIGWLYQFYISEKKDTVFEGLKKNQKITPENIPAATQLFTPHWIVRYLVENSLGRLWMLNRPGSRLAEKMDYYIKPEQPETDFLKISSPEEIKICDPACGSGHMLTYAFDMLYAIYEEEGVDAAEIPEKILTYNLYGIEIDERAGELAAFALTMKARAKQRRFFNKGIKPNICVLENVKFDADELTEYMDFIGRDLFTAPLQTTLRQFEEADNFGSLIRPDVTDVDGMLRILESKNVSGHLFLSQTHQKVLQALRQADQLSPKYHVLIANPPYMGSGNFNPRLKNWLSKTYKVTRSDLYAIFIERSFELLMAGGRLAMVTMQSWMFTRSYEELRETILRKCQINTLAQLGTKAFDEISGEIVQTCAFVLQTGGPVNQPTTFIRLVDGDSGKKEATLVSGENRFAFNQLEFSKIPGKVMVYWTGDLIVEIFEKFPPAGQFGEFREGIHTGDNNAFLRYWWEVSWSKASLVEDSCESIDLNRVKWIPYNKGGTPVRWYGGNEWVISFDRKSRDAMEKLSGHVRPSQGFYFKEGATWPDVSSGKFGVRYYPHGFLFDAKGPVFVGSYLNRVIAILNSSTFTYLASLLMPTLAFKCGTVRNIPVPDLSQLTALDGIANELIKISKERWDESEKSWGFNKFYLARRFEDSSLISDLIAERRGALLQQEERYQSLESQNDQIASQAYGLDGVDSGTNESTESVIEDDGLTGTIRELVSYAVGCMFGRYSLDKPGLILASQGETLADYLRQVPEPSFPADDDNVIPMLDGDWFTDDIAERFRQFLRVAFGEAHYEENLQFVEKALDKKGKPQPIRDYFLKEFYSDHVKRYKKRPIYWLFSSPKGTFNALIYLHRYRPDTVSVVLNGYLRDFRNKLAAHLSYLQQVGVSATASQAEKTRANKEIDTIKKQLQELDDYERDVLYPLATEQKAIDLDDGVKVNYLKFGPALKKIPGLEVKDED